jgi:hypothetical protein
MTEHENRDLPFFVDMSDRAQEFEESDQTQIPERQGPGPSGRPAPSTRVLADRGGVN